MGGRNGNPYQLVGCLGVKEILRLCVYCGCVDLLYFVWLVLFGGCLVVL